MMASTGVFVYLVSRSTLIQGLSSLSVWVQDPYKAANCERYLLSMFMYHRFKHDLIYFNKFIILLFILSLWCVYIA